MNISLNILKLTLIAAILSFLASCATLNSRQTQLSAKQYLTLAKQAQGEKQQYYRLQAAHIFATTNRVKQANALATELTGIKLAKPLATSLQLLQAQLALANQRNNDAIELLRNIDPSHSLLPQEQQMQFYQAFAKAYENSGDIIDSVLMRQQLGARLSTEQEKKQNAWAIWQMLQTQTRKQLTQEIAQTPSESLSGWLKFTLITKEYDSDPNQLINHLSAWRNEFPTHDANRLLPHSLQSAVGQPLPSNIALLLPLTGRYADYGQAIRNGFFTAYYNLKKRHGFAPKLAFFDTNHQNINTLYRQAVTQGAQFIIGPLRKENVSALLNNQNRTVPVLALNTVPESSPSNTPPFYEFGLSPTDEAKRVANRALRDHQHNIVVIAPQSDWGKRVANAFSTEWEKLGGNITETQYYNKQRTLSTDMRKLLGIDQAYTNKHQLQHVLREKMRFIPRRRKDFDAIFLVSSPKNARQIKPLLRFYFAGGIPVYAISTTFSPTYNHIENNDLNGIIFGDMPWVLAPNALTPTYLNTIQKRIQSLWPKKYRQHPTFFALGVDALQILQSLPRMTTLPSLGTKGATGTLFLTANQRISRQLTFATIKKGKVVIVQ